MPRALWLLIIGMVINVTAASFLWPLNTIYIHDHLGKSLTVAGFVLMLNSAAGIIGNLVGGHLFDKIGGYKSILIGISITLSALLTLVFFHEWPAYVALLAIIGLGGGIVFPSMYAFAGSVWPEGGRKAFNAIYVAQNLGVAIGSALGGVVASVSFTYIFVANATVYIFFLAVAVFGYKKISAKADSRSITIPDNQHVKSSSKRMALYILAIGYILCWVAYVQWQSTIATHTQSLGIPLEQYSLLWTVNGALIVLGQPLIAYVAKRIPSLKMQIIVGTIIFMSAFVLAGNTSVFYGFLAAMVILTIGEMLVWPAVPTIANDLAPEGREGFYQGVVNSAATGGRMVGPLLGGIIVDLFGMAALFYVLVGLLIISIITTTLYNRGLKRESLASNQQHQFN
ncbi:MFS transporter [Bacillus sp. HMF5848]|uniref:MDR family MFS transporter n=1 Tax=Bacillus sp. HMF5848 TaxID=2495421 RepID=UPI000F79519F|nr:MFS transporter [Bacillus sp. HMF5848]RSK28241.1 MFS transporter [Bacillus sp. HMF5848]